MNKEAIEKILDRLERIDHKKYSCSFEFADTSSFEEMGVCFEERKKLANYIKELQQENKQLKEVLYEIRNIDIFKEFSFPLMKRWEEQQVLSSIDYQFKNTFIRKINEILKGDNNENTD